MATTQVSQPVNDNKYYWEHLAPPHMKALKAEMDRFFTYNGRFPKLDEEWSEILSRLQG